ncbi:choline monooxygenase [Phyllobacterium myrsinacearum]|uniref:aromatic ring-hydroxylating oxygenase subunit alpha n=1 Tax=Phyllobacterium myrsinacearum TaxID=28101 RepID=UPI0010F1A5DD|nr:aromatic ring-hydroxylating dioxygenase subunit alpha [Phyllobacterium myrsinacearum]RZS76873.1 choline monooxygenase [Phyllobacterium myrsinacearum]
MNPVQLYQAALHEQLDQPLATATSLDSVFYTSPDVFAAEMEALSSRTWRVVAAAGQLSQPNSVHSLTMTGQPLVVTRAADGTIRCFHNVCKHRGVPLVTESATAIKAMRCPYHGWRYRLDGTLERASHFNGIGDHRVCNTGLSSLDLDDIRCATWNGLVFANAGGEAPPLTATMQALDTRWHEYDFTQFEYGGDLHYRLAGNWKLVVENFLDSYHNPFVHPALNKASSWKAHYPIVEPDYFGVGSNVYQSDVAGHGGLPILTGLSPAGQRRAEYLCVTPTLMLGLHADYLFVLTIDPIDAQTTDEHVYFFFVGADKDDPKVKSARRNVLENWDRINREDIPVVEGMQVCRNASPYGTSVFSPFHEGPMHAFQRQVAQLMANRKPKPRQASVDHAIHELVGSEA